MAVKFLTNRGYREIGYKEDYACTIEIIGYDYDSSEKVVYTLYEAYPTQIGAVSNGMGAKRYDNSNSY